MDLIEKWFVLAGQGGFPCLFHSVTGAYCPGCGGTRAARALLSGHLWMSFLYHPLVPYLAFVLPLLLLMMVYYRKKKKPFPQIVWKLALFAAIAILIANFVLKNYFLLFQGNDILTRLDRLN